MDNNNVQLVSVEQIQNTSSEFNFKAFVNKCLKNKIWFFLSILVCLGAACFYILRTNPVYSRSATILIKDTDRRSIASSDLESMLAVGTSRVSTKVANEVIAFRSPALMLQVVEKLNLSTSFGVKGRFREKVLYGHQVPFSVEFLDIPSFYTVKMDVSPTSQGVSITNLKYKYKSRVFKDFETINANYGDSVQTAIGRLVFKDNPHFSGEWQETITVNQTSSISATTQFINEFTASAVDSKERADILKLSIVDQSIQRADDILNTIIEIYNKNWIADRNLMAVSTSNFINERLVTLEKELGDVDKDISSYKSTNLIPDENTVSSLLADQTMENARSMQEIENQLYVYRYIGDYLSDPDRADQLIPMAGSVSNSGISTQILEYNKMLLNRNNILANSSEKNPLVQDLNASLLPTRRAIETSISNQIATLESQLEHIRSVGSKTENKISENPSQIQYLTTVGRQQKVKEALYLFLLEKREENELSQAFSAYNTRVITPPMGISSPVGPKTTIILAIALFLGLILPLLFFYFSTIMDSKVRSRKDFEGIDIPFIGEIPLKHHKMSIGGNKHSPERMIVVKEGNRDIINEAFRVIRTNIEFMSKGKGAAVMTISSFEPDSGKTFVSVNLAIALAIKGHRVLVIDGDMRHASLSTLAGVQKQGLSTYLNGALDDWKEATVEFNRQKNLSILPVGALPPNPSELISEERFATMLQEAREIYDFILIDCPPLEMVADTRIISQYADRCIFISRAGLMEKSYVPVIQKLSTEGNMKNLSIVLNGTESFGSYGAGYGYHYSGYYSQKA